MDTDRLLQDFAARVRADPEPRPVIVQQPEPGGQIIFPNRYPPVPSLMLTPDLPKASGIYFLWLGNGIDYVGQARRLRDRLRLGAHHVLTAAHRVSFLTFPRKELNWAECYYIGLTRPPKNFGQRAADPR